MNTTETTKYLERSERISSILRLARILGEPRCQNSARSIEHLYRVSMPARMARWIRAL